MKQALSPSADDHPTRAQVVSQNPRQKELEGVTEPPDASGTASLLRSPGRRGEYSLLCEDSVRPFHSYQQHFLEYTYCYPAVYTHQIPLYYVPAPSYQRYYSRSSSGGYYDRWDEDDDHPSSPSPSLNGRMRRSGSSGISLPDEVVTMPRRRTTRVGFAEQGTGAHPVGHSISLTSVSSRGSSNVVHLEDLQTSEEAYSFFSDPMYSGCLQHSVQSASPEVRKRVFKLLLSEECLLSMQGHICHIVRLFLAGADGAELALTAATGLKDRVLTLAFDQYGCRILQYIMEADSRAAVAVAQPLEPQTLRCIRDRHANHVISKCLETVKATTDISLMANLIVSNALELACEPYGCRVVQRFLKHYTSGYEGNKEEEKDDDDDKKEDLSDSVCRKLVDVAVTFAHDMYGVYAIQHIILSGKEPFASTIAKKVASRVMAMAQHRYASTVVEACLNRQEDASVVVQAIVQCSEQWPHLLLAVATNCYGNFVIQKALDKAIDDEAQRGILMRCLESYIHVLERDTYGKHIAVKVQHSIGRRL